MGLVDIMVVALPFPLLVDIMADGLPFVLPVDIIVDELSFELSVPIIELCPNEVTTAPTKKRTAR
jgi:hypothetical protein